MIAAVLGLVGSLSQLTVLGQAVPIALDAVNPHYFSYGGKTIALITSGEHYGAVFNLDVDYTRYLATLKADGLNYTRIFGGSYVEVPGKSFGILRNDLAPAPGKFLAPWVRSGEAGYAGGGNKFDLDHWNPEYFVRLKAFLSEAERQGIVVEVSLFSAQYGEPQWAISPFNPVNNVNGTELADWKKLETMENGKILGYQEQYVRKLVHETAGFGNVIFEIQNEPWSDRPRQVNVINPYLFPPGRDQYPNSVEVADELSSAWQGKVAGWITDEEGSLAHKHLIAQNYSNFQSSIIALVPGVSMVNFHYAYPEAVTLNYGLGKAISYDETGFLGQGDAGYRRQAWNFMLSGGGAFDALDYSFTPGHEAGDDTAPNGPGGGSPAFRSQLGILARFLAGFPVRDLAPDPHVVQHAAGATAHALNAHGDTWAIYLDAGPEGNAPAGSDLALHLADGSYSAEWVDVTTGKPAGQERFTCSGGSQTLHSPPYASGIAFRLNRMKQ